MEVLCTEPSQRVERPEKHWVQISSPFAAVMRQKQKLQEHATGPSSLLKRFTKADNRLDTVHVDLLDIVTRIDWLIPLCVLSSL